MLINHHCLYNSFAGTINECILQPPIVKMDRVKVAIPNVETLPVADLVPKFQLSLPLFNLTLNFLLSK
jgi:hypothetical protein